MVKLPYNITIFHLKILDVICKCNCKINFYDTATSLTHVQDDMFERSYTKVPVLFIALTAVLY